MTDKQIKMPITIDDLVKIKEEAMKDMCVWKLVCNNDERKKAEGNIYITFKSNETCIKCNGYDNGCGYYVRNTYNPNRK